MGFCGLLWVAGRRICSRLKNNNKATKTNKIKHKYPLNFAHHNKGSN